MSDSLRVDSVPRVRIDSTGEPRRVRFNSVPVCTHCDHEIHGPPYTYLHSGIVIGFCSSAHFMMWRKENPHERA